MQSGPDDFSDYRTPGRRRRIEYDAPRRPQSDTLATVSLALGVLSFCFSVLTGIPAILCGFISLARSSSGKGLAITGIILGGISTVASIGLLLLLIPAMGKVRDAATRTQDLNNLSIIGMGVHQAASRSNDLRTLPAANGPVSWRVLILPYIGQRGLFNEFNILERWDSPKNRPLSTRAVREYLPSTDPMGKESTETRIRVFTGPQTYYPPGGPATLTPPDGASNTIYAVHAEERVPWSQPKELAYDPNGPLPKFSTQHSNGFLVLMGDGSTHMVNKSVSEKTLRAAITASGGETPGADW